ncbi:MAG TPA: DUF6800 family protein [Candidatus Binatia bacterium]|nr:DUF6800 family protein [Candidatus Binatia bacterium]
MGRQVRRNELHARRVRRQRLQQLRERYAKAKTSAEKDKIMEKVSRVAPSLSSEQFLAPIKTG